MQKMSLTLKRAIHDLNNIFTSNQAAIEQLQPLLKDNPPSQKLLLTLGSNSLRAIEIINSLSKNHKKEKRTITLESILNDVISTVEPSLGEGIKINLNLAKSFSKVNGYYTDLYRAFLNLTINAIESIEDKGSIEYSILENIETKSVDILISDSGLGIPTENLKSIFNSGFSTKGRERESGHGLAIVKEIITQHNGTISVTSNLNKGTVFKITLPKVATKNETLSKNENAKILLVDDDNSILELFSDLLSSYNYNVIAVNCGENAFAEFQKVLDFDLIIIDKTLPDIDGLELIKKMRKDNSEIPIILMSGSHETIDYDFTDLGINEKIKKPFDFEIMLSKIKTLLF